MGHRKLILLSRKQEQPLKISCRLMTR